MGETIRTVAAELLQLYDWRFELARMENDPNTDEKELRRLLLDYGSRKKRAWEALRKLLGDTRASD